MTQMLEIRVLVYLENREFLGSGIYVISWIRTPSLPKRTILANFFQTKGLNKRITADMKHIYVVFTSIEISG